MLPLLRQHCDPKNDVLEIRPGESQLQLSTQPSIDDVSTAMNMEATPVCSSRACASVQHSAMLQQIDVPCRASWEMSTQLICC